MQTTEFISAWATMVLMLPFGALLALSFFGLDKWLAAPQRRTGSRRRFCELGPDGQLQLLDPGGCSRKIAQRDGTPARADANGLSLPPEEPGSALCLPLNPILYPAHFTIGYVPERQSTLVVSSKESSR